MNQQSTALNWALVLVSLVLTLCTLIIDDSVLIKNLELSTSAMAVLKLVAYLVLPIVAMYNGKQIYNKTAK